MQRVDQILSYLQWDFLVCNLSMLSNNVIEDEQKRRRMQWFSFTRELSPRRWECTNLHVNWIKTKRRDVYPSRHTHYRCRVDEKLKEKYYGDLKYPHLIKRETENKIKTFWYPYIYVNNHKGEPRQDFYFYFLVSELSYIINYYKETFWSPWIEIVSDLSPKLTHYIHLIQGLY